MRAGDYEQIINYDWPNRLTSTHKGIERFVCLAFDEIKVRSNLFFNKYNDELIGFVDLGDPEFNYSTFTDLD